MTWNRLRDKSITLLRNIDQLSNRNSATSRPLVRMFNEYVDTISNLAHVSSLIHRSWQPHVAQIPTELDLRRLATTTLELSEQLKQELDQWKQNFSSIRHSRTK